MTLDGLLQIMDKLLGPDGCPWDREQTHNSLTQNMLEEAQEAVEAIVSGNTDSIKEELGDVLLQVIFHAKIAEKNGTFTMNDIMQILADKLINRHSHVFGTDIATTAEEALELWKANKIKHLTNS